MPYTPTKIGLKALQTNRLHILLITIVICFHTFSFAQSKTEVTVADSIPSSEKTLDSIPAPQKDAIQHIISHSAEDYIEEDLLHKRVTLYNNAHLVYDSYDITAGKITIDYDY